MIRVALVVKDTLQQIGLRTVVEEYFQPVEVEVIKVEELTDDYNLYIVDGEVFVMQQEFIAPRRSKVVTLVNQAEVQGNTMVVSSSWTLEQMVDVLSGIFNQISKSDSNTNEELSAREIQVLQLIVKGSINRDIASQLNISLNTVLTHRKNITSKLGIKTVSGLTLYALMHGYM